MKTLSATDCIHSPKTHDSFPYLFWGNRSAGVMPKSSDTGIILP
jgi:hypothetical protein